MTQQFFVLVCDKKIFIDTENPNPWVHLQKGTISEGAQFGP